MRPQRTSGAVASDPSSRTRPLQPGGRLSGGRNETALVTGRSGAQLPRLTSERGQSGAFLRKGSRPVFQHRSEAFQSIRGARILIRSFTPDPRGCGDVFEHVPAIDDLTYLHKKPPSVVVTP